MKDLQQVTASLDKIAFLDQQIFSNDLEVLKKIKTDVRKISQLPALIQKKTFLGHVLDLEAKENKVSDILAFFFNPKEVHGYSDLFLTTLAECLNKKSDRIWDLNWKNFEEIEREHKFADQSRIDLVLYFENLVLGIEHKIYAELDNPLKEYLKGLQKIAKESEKKAKLIVFSLNKYPAEELKNCINITYAEFYAALRDNYKAICKNKEKSPENFQKAMHWQSIFEDFLISMENLIGVQNMTKEQRERQSLIWELFTKNNMAAIIEEYEDNVVPKFENAIEDLEKDFKQIIEKFGFVVKKDFLNYDDDDNDEPQKNCANLNFQTKEKTILTLWIDNVKGKLTASIMQWHEDKNYNESVLKIKDSPYDWSNWPGVFINDQFLSQDIDSNPYADDFAEKVLTACEGVLGTLAETLKYTK